MQPVVPGNQTTPKTRFARILLLLLALSPALHDAQAATVLVGSDGANTVDSTNYTDPVYSNLVKGGTNTVALTGTRHLYPRDHD